MQITQLATKIIEFYFPLCEESTICIQFAREWCTFTQRFDGSFIICNYPEIDASN